jgi:hypothetical protein
LHSEKIVPSEVDFDPLNPQHREFVLRYGFLRLQTIKAETVVRSLAKDSSTLSYSNFTQSVMNVSIWEQLQADLQKYVEVPMTHLTDRIVGTLKLLHARAHDIPTEPLKLELTSLEFDKDDVKMGQINFIHSAAQLRASNYRLLPRLERTKNLDDLGLLYTRRLAGNIIPAVITSTAMAASLAVSELIKIAVNRVQSRTQRPQLSKSTLLRSSPIGVDGPQTQNLNKIMRRRRIPFTRWIVNKCLTVWRVAKFQCSKFNKKVISTSPSNATISKDNRILFEYPVFVQADNDEAMKNYRNYYVDVAAPSVAYSAPMYAAVSECSLSVDTSGNGTVCRRWNEWQFIEVRHLFEGLFLFSL